MNTVLLLLLAIPLIIIAYAISLYNALVQLKMKVEEALADIDTFLKQRYDMIPNLVEIVKGYAKHEQETLEKLTELRSKAMQTENVADRVETENQISQTLKSLFAVAENYPDLKANTNFLDLQQKLTGLEDNIQKSRRYYNGTVQNFNTKIATFPNNLLAGPLGYKPYKFFAANEEEKENVKVQF
ncbi:LemA family protein [Candidatus Dojkabacteria bacterium]|uniref:LemA family protein n=1 Tax=Candidatus Dojkabacteria bacterium TaxID=2099670 RepID=A0A955L3Z1_9BACT|nr:LemA family protein [Candidatus Dojkabacteria bacterium]